MSATGGNLKSKDTPRLSTEHHPLGTEGLWHTPDKHTPDKQQLPAYIQNIAHALMRDHGFTESHAIATALNATDRWRHGNPGTTRGHIHPEVQTASERAHQEWEQTRAVHH